MTKEKINKILDNLDFKTFKFLLENRQEIYNYLEKREEREEIEEGWKDFSEKRD
jgi:hypothetical protein